MDDNKWITTNEMRAIKIYESEENIIIRIINIKMVSLEIVFISHFSRHEIELIVIFNLIYI